LVLYYSGASRESSVIINEQIKNARLKTIAAIESMHKVKDGALLMKENLLKGNIVAFAHYLGQAWESKKGMASAITNKQIEDIFSLALENGAIGGKISGAGGGGYIMFMTGSTNRIKLINTLNKLGGKVVNAHFTEKGVQTWTAEKL
jgi:D-glycero-alpha-D-manno-heptose-7-phosphate kinase